jgi:hypothetical protein
MRAALLLVVAASLLVAGCSAEQEPASSNPATTPAFTPPEFQRAVVVVFENHDRSGIADSGAAPTFRAYAGRFASLPGYRGVAHPSLPNYLALVSGSTQGITGDCTTCTIAAESVADSLDAAGLSWKTYAEDLPSPGFLGAKHRLYGKEHDPLVYFDSIATQPDRLRRIVPFARFHDDLAAGALPRFSLVVPNLCHDLHVCPVATGDAWLKRFLRELLRSRQMRRGVVFVIFDESESYAGGGGGSVFAFAAGGAVRPHSVNASPLSHYNVLATLEANWGLPRLGLSSSAQPITRIWRGGK